MRRLSTRRVLLVLVAGISAAPWIGQAQVDQKPLAFDVATIKPNTSLEESANYVTPGGRYTAQAMTLRALIKVAYGVHDSQIAGGPGWIDTDRWDVTAKAEEYAKTPAPAFRDTARLMVRPLLADRFKLALRREPRELPVYALVVARTNQFGPQFRRSDEHNCAGPPTMIQPAAGAKEPAVPLPCGADLFRPGHLSARGMTLTNMLVALNRFAMDRVVVDRTGLTGKFDWEIQWTPDELTAVNPPPSEGPSVFDAFREQAGLRLEARKDTAEVLVIDHAERPIPD